MDGSLSIDKALPRPLRVILRGVGQVFFCCNAVTGLVFLIALYIGGITAGLAATVGVISSTVAAYLLGFSEDDIDAGLYGFNGTLVGPCLFLFLENTPQLWLFVVLASVVSTVVLAALMRILQPYNIPASTSPFVLTCWMFMIAVYSFDMFSRGPVLPAPAIPAEITAASAVPMEFSAMTQETAVAWLTAITKGIGEVMFADSVIVGILFLVGIAITSLRGALMALGGAIVGVVIPVILGADKTLIQMGLYAFNPVLTMMAVGWVFLKPTTGSAILALLAGIVTIICQAGLANFLAPLGLPTLTFPFVLVMWMFLFAASKSKYWAHTP
ncbi:urea transporter [Nitrosomonas sp. JL21]|uniref:urea transporter n=1 Tax=Nitrosomonas sp. JL21 TaxID=153949 RepID=UPI00136CED93|nr:urea transporter [Nitrosomonas sp. JL21]MBL8496511.1 urea transporter [Nitrosomonas sp.]MCC7091692.1 urea transporter [Nitrosomonas sp.]MXS76901.1 urea transporter [Nitrosomonas sp. JL21]